MGCDQVYPAGVVALQAVLIALSLAACRTESTASLEAASSEALPTTATAAPSAAPPVTVTAATSEHEHPARQADCVKVKGVDGEPLDECAYAVELHEIELCEQCCPDRTGCDKHFPIYVPDRGCEESCVEQHNCSAETPKVECSGCLYCCASHRCKFGFGEYAGTLLTLRSARLSLWHPYPASPGLWHLTRQRPPDTPPKQGPACKGMNFAQVGLTLSDGTFVPLLVGNDKQGVECEGPWSTSREGLPDWAPVFDDPQYPGPCYPVSCPAWVWKPQDMVVRAVERGFLLVAPPSDLVQAN